MPDSFMGVDFTTVDGRLYISLQGTDYEAFPRNYNTSIELNRPTVFGDGYNTSSTGEISLNADFILIHVESIPESKPKKKKEQPKLKRKPRERRLIDV